MVLKVDLGSEPLARMMGRREEILACSAKLFAEHGFDQATMRQIGKAAGMQPASLYHHFKTKEDILDEIIRGFLAGLPIMYDEIRSRTDNTRQILHDFIALGFRASLKNRTVMTIIIHERKLFARLPRFAYVEKTMRDVERIWQEVLEEGVKRGAFRKELNLALVLRMMLDLAGSAVEWYRPNSRRYSLDDVIEAQLALIFHGISAE